MLIKTSELSGPALDWAVAKCEGWDYLAELETGGTEMRYGTYICGLADGGFEYGFTFGEVANEDDVHTVGPCEIGDSEFDVVLGVAYGSEVNAIEPAWEKYRWVAEAIIAASKLRVADGIKVEHEGETARIAAMRCYVASRLGAEVEIPEGLL